MKTLSLTPVEHDLRRLLLDVAKHIKDEDQKAKASELRFTGGWVRDKLLDQASHDIDVAIDDMTGEQFGLRMKAFLEIPGNAERYGLQGVATDETTSEGKPDKSKLVGGLHKISANPEKSKHLETVTTKIFGLDVDLVNLRKEVYDEESRNPQMQFADSPEEDAFRRDATINAMFYNLQTEQVEDLTKRGLDDMKNRIIRTPLEPFQTFRDDPLRVLRLIRFASRLSYTIDDAAKQAMQHPTIKDALARKISRERVGVELNKMLQGGRPYMALDLIHEVGLYHDIFCVPQPAATEKSTPAISHALQTNFRPDTGAWEQAYKTVFFLAFPPRSDNAIGNGVVPRILVQGEGDWYFAWLLSCFVPFGNAPEPPRAGKAIPPIAAVVAKEGIKANSKVTDLIMAAVENAPDIIRIKDQVTESGSPRVSQSLRSAVSHPVVIGRDVLGNAVRRWGPTWRLQTLYACLLEYTERPYAYEMFFSRWSKFLTHLQEEDLLEAYNLKPIVDGKELAKALNTRPGSWMKEALEVVMSWQLLHPNDATERGAIEAVKVWHGEKDFDKDQMKEVHNSSAGELTASLIHHYLSLTIRPLFAKTLANHSDSITPQARAKQQTTETPIRRRAGLEDEAVTRPWKLPVNSPSLDLLRWCTEKLTPELTEKEWPLLIPPILTLLDDIGPKYKALGATLLQNLLKATSLNLLRRTAMAHVFHASLKPSLYYLPSMTPEAESVELLNAVYPTLFDLYRKPNINNKDRATSSKSTKSDSDAGTLSSTRRELLTDLLHTHVLTSFSHIEAGSACAYPGLTTALLTHLRALIQELGVNSTAQLIYVMPLLRGILCDNPFAASTLPNLDVMAEAAKTLQVVIRSAWVRMPEWRGEVLNVVGGAWSRVLEEEGDSSGVEDEAVASKRREVKEALRRVFRDLRSAIDAVGRARVQLGGNEVGLGGEADALRFEREVRALVKADDRFKGLFSGLAADERDEHRKVQVPPDT